MNIRKHEESAVDTAIKRSKRNSVRTEKESQRIKHGAA